MGGFVSKKKGYIPTTKDGYVIKSGHVSIKADRYYVSVLVEIPDNKMANNSSEGIGIDLGLKDLAIISNGKTYKNINRSAKLKKLENNLLGDREVCPENMKIQRKESPLKERIYKNKRLRCRNFIKR